MGMNRGTKLLTSGVTLAALFACGNDSGKASLEIARTALERGDSKAATIALKNALQDSPSSPEARFLYGKALMESGQLAAAVLELRKAVELKHPLDQVAPVLAKTLVGLQQDKKLVEEFGTFESSNVQAKADVMASVALSLMRLGESQKAKLLVTDTLRRVPAHAPSLLVRARLDASAGNVDDALAAVESALIASPRNHDALQLQGDLLLHGKHDSALATAAYSKALMVDGANLGTHTALVGIALNGRNLALARRYFEAMVKAAPNHPQTRFVQAQIAAFDGDFKKAAELLPILLAAAPENARLLQFAGFVELNVNAVGRAVSHLNKSITLAPDLAAARTLLARAYLRSGQADKALDLLKPLLARDSPDSETLTIAAEAHLLSGNVENAESFFKRASQVNPGNTRARTALALTQLARGRADMGYAELQAVSVSNKDTLADLALINVRMRRLELDGALKAIDALQSKQPNSPVPEQLRGQIHLTRRDLPAARASFEAALAKDPVYLPAVSSLVKLDMSEMNPGAAQKRLENLLKTDAKNSGALLAMAELSASNGAPKQDVAQWLDKAVAANPVDSTARLMLVDHWLAVGDPKAALAAAQGGLLALPDSPELLDSLGRAQLAAGETQQAINTFGKLAINQPKSPGPLLRLARAHAYAKDEVSAMRSIGQALELAPELPAAQRDLLMLAVASRKPNDALQVARRLQLLRPTEAIGFRLAGDIHAEFKDWDAALKAYRTALSKANPRAVPERIYVALLEAKKSADADQFAKDWITRNPTDAKFRAFLGQTAMTKQDFGRAQTHFQAAVKLDPNDAKSLNNLAWVMVKSKQPGALPIAERAVMLAPDSAAVLDTLALAYAAENQLDKALGAAKSAMMLAPAELAYRLNLARIYLRANNKAAAKEELTQLSKLGAKFSAQAEVTELLKGL